MNMHKNKTFNRAIFYIALAILLALIFEKWWFGQIEWVAVYYGEEEESYQSISVTKDHLDQLVNL